MIYYVPRKLLNISIEEVIYSGRYICEVWD